MYKCTVPVDNKKNFYDISPYLFGSHFPVRTLFLSLVSKLKAEIVCFCLCLASAALPCPYWMLITLTGLPMAHANVLPLLLDSFALL